MMKHSLKLKTQLDQQKITKKDLYGTSAECTNFTSEQIDFLIHLATKYGEDSTVSKKFHAFYKFVRF